MPGDSRPFFVFQPGAVYSAKQVKQRFASLKQSEDDVTVRVLATVFRLWYGNDGDDREAARKILGGIDKLLRKEEYAEEIGRFLRLANERQREFGLAGDYLRSILQQPPKHESDKLFEDLVRFLMASGDATAHHDSVMEIQRFRKVLGDWARGIEVKPFPELIVETPPEADGEEDVEEWIEMILRSADPATRRTLAKEISRFRTMLRDWRLHYDPQLDARLIVGLRHTMRGHTFAGRVLNALGAPPRLVHVDDNLAPAPSRSFLDEAHRLPRLPTRSPCGETETEAWRAVGEEHRECLRDAVGRFIEELGRAANLRDFGLPEDSRLKPDAVGRLKLRMRPVCYVVNHFSNAVEYLDLKQPEHLPAWVGSLRLPHAVRPTGVARSLPAAFLGADGEGMRFKLWSGTDLRDAGSGLFGKREHVRQLWTLNVRTDSWQLLLLINWVALDDDATEPAPAEHTGDTFAAEDGTDEQGEADAPRDECVGFDAATSAALAELFRDVHGGARQFAGWIHSSDLDLAQPEEALFDGFADVAQKLGEALWPATDAVRRERLRALTTTALQRTPAGRSGGRAWKDLQGSIVVSTVSPVRSSDTATGTLLSEYLMVDAESGWVAHCCPQTNRPEPIELGEGDMLLLEGLVEHGDAPDATVLFLGSDNHRRVFDCRLDASGTTPESLAALSAAWCTPILCENLSEDITLPMLRNWVEFSGTRGEEAEKPSGSELHVPIPGALTGTGQREACGVISLHSPKVGQLGQCEAAAVDTIARVYGYTRFAQHDPTLSAEAQQENHELLDRVLTQAIESHPERIERVLALANEDICRWTGATMAYFLIRDFRGTCGFRNVGLACHDDTMEAYVCARGLMSAQADHASGTTDDNARTPTEILSSLKDNGAIAALDRFIKRSLRSHLVPRRQGYTSHMIRENKGCLVLGSDELNKTASQPELLSQLGINQLVGLVFRSPLAATPLGGLWLCFDQDKPAADPDNVRDWDRNMGLSKREFRKKHLGKAAMARARGQEFRKHEDRLRSMLDALGALVSINRLCVERAHTPTG